MVDSYEILRSRILGSVGDRQAKYGLGPFLSGYDSTWRATRFSDVNLRTPDVVLNIGASEPGKIKSYGKTIIKADKTVTVWVTDLSAKPPVTRFMVDIPILGPHCGEIVHPETPQGYDYLVKTEGGLHHVETPNGSGIVRAMHHLLDTVMPEELALPDVTRLARATDAIVPGL